MHTHTQGFFLNIYFFSVTFASNRISMAENMVSANFPSSEAPAQQTYVILMLGLHGNDEDSH